MKPGHNLDRRRTRRFIESARTAGLPERIALALAAIALSMAGCNRPLPEQNTAAAHLYASRCGQCHRPYSPESLTTAMWQIQLELMQTRMQQNGVPPLSGKERDIIMSYLARNAAHD
jgi:hypothetical protein